MTVGVDKPGCKASIGHMVALICHKSINNLHLQDFFLITNIGAFQGEKEFVDESLFSKD